MPKARLNFILPALGLVVLLAGCASGVKLDQPETPVEQREPFAPGAAASAAGGEASAAGASSAGVGGAGLPGGASQIAPVVAPPVAPDPLTADAAEADRIGRVVYFDYDSHTLRPADQPLIEAQGRLLARNPKRRVLVEGHTDGRGVSEYNLALGQRRAEAVVRALRLLGVAEDQLEATSYGKERPAVSGEGEEAWAKNRRAEIRER